jgi:hypothetical protein
MCFLVLLAEVSGWDKMSAIASVIAAIAASTLLLAGAYPVVRRWRSTWRSKNAASLETDGHAFVGVKHEETLIVRFHRTVFCHEPGVALRDVAMREHGSIQIPGIRQWIDPWLDPEGNPHKFPKRLNRGDALRTTLHIQAEQEWKGVIRVQAFSEGLCAFQVQKPFEVHPASSPRATQLP